MTALEQAQADLLAAENTYLGATTDVATSQASVTTAQADLNTKLGIQQTAVVGYVTALKNAIAVENTILSGLPLPPVSTAASGS